MPDITAETLDAIAAFGFDIYMPVDPHWQTYAYYTDGKRIAYFQNDRLEGFCISTVNIPCKECGTGFRVTDVLKNPFQMTREYLETGFAIAPDWARQSDRNAVRKHPDPRAYVESQRLSPMRLVRTGTSPYKRGNDDYAAIRDAASDPAQRPAIVSEEEYEDMLGCVPPIYVDGVAGFLVGEALTSDARGTVYANYYQSRDGLFCARYHVVEG